MKLRTTIMASALCGLMTLSGCMSTLESMTESIGLGNDNKSDPDPRLTTEEFEVNPLSYVTAGLTGAIAAGTTAVLAANENYKSVSVLASMSGLVMFMGANYALDYVRESYFSYEQELEKLSEELSERRQKASYVASVANEVYEEDHAKLEKLQDDIEKDTIEKEKLQQFLARYDGNIEVLDKNLEYYTLQCDNASKSLIDIKSTEAYLSGNELDSLVADCESEINLLEARVEELSDLIYKYNEDRNVLNLAINAINQKTDIKSSEIKA